MPRVPPGPEACHHSQLLRARLGAGGHARGVGDGRQLDAVRGWEKLREIAEDPKKNLVLEPARAHPVPAVLPMDNR